MRKVLALSLVFFSICFFSQSCQKKVEGDTYADVLKAFVDPPAEYRSAPLWVWNDRITKEQIETQLADFKAHGIGGVFIHPRPGLITPYLSEEWLGLCRMAVDAGKSLGMKVWIYDENSYPSGFAGGHVPADMPESIGLGLRMTKATEIPVSFTEKPILLLRRTESGFENITEKAVQPGAGVSLGTGDYYIFDVQKAEPSPWFGGFTYVDLMRKDVTEKFLDVTLNAYKRAIGDEFGLTVPGSFQDEAHIGPVMDKNIVNFTPALFDKFQEKWGYDLRPSLPSLFEETGDWRAVRHDFYATTLELFSEGWAKPYYDYCAANNLWLTGHYLEHEWPGPNYTSDYLAMSAYSHMPGIDCLMNQWDSGPHGQFGNARPPKEMRSVANQLGRQRIMSETYGAGGWDLRFFDQKRIADWEFALGINFINQHLSYVTIMGARKRDHPQSFSYHEPWWHAYKIMGDYLGRLSVVTSLGEQRNRILVLEPTTTAWMYYSPTVPEEKLKAIGDDFTRFINLLEAAQVEYDLGSEDVLRHHGSAGKKALLVGERAYEALVIPPGLENLGQSTIDLLSPYLAAGGRIVSCVQAPRSVNGKGSEAARKIAESNPKNWLALSENEVIDSLAETCSRDIQFSELEGDRMMFFHHRRVLADAELVFLANVSPDKAVKGGFIGRGNSVEKWDPFTGRIETYPSEPAKGKVGVKFDIQPGGSLLLCLRKVKTQAAAETEARAAEIEIKGSLRVSRQSPNVLTLDYCDLRLGGRTARDLYFYDAQKETFRHHGLDRNPWDNAVQYKTQILDLDKFPPTSGFEADYWFEAARNVNLASLQLVAERPQLFQVFINDRKVEPLQGRWWLDRAFGVFDIGPFSRIGKNKVTLKAAPFTIHTELEPVYLLGDFGLESQPKGFRLVPTQELKVGPWPEQGLPLYSDGVAYAVTLAVDSLDKGRERYFVRLGDWLGSIAEVKVGGKTAGFIAFQPFELDITDSMSSGENEISVVVYGTLKNSLGPHHNSPPLGMAWPGMFQKGAEGGYPAGAKYSVVGYGLFENFKILVKRS